MALKGVVRPGYIQIRVLDTDAAVRHYVDRVGLHEVSREPDGRVYLRAWDEFDRHSVVLRRADMPGMDCVGFKVASDADLDSFRRRIKECGTKVAEVPAGEQPGLGRRLSFVVPTGHRIELFSEMALSHNGPMTQNPEIWRDEPHGMRVTRFDHCNLHGPDIPGVVKFFTEVLDFSLTEAAETPDGVVAAFNAAAERVEIGVARHLEPDIIHAWHIRAAQDYAVAIELVPGAEIDTAVRLAADLMEADTIHIMSDCCVCIEHPDLDITGSHHTLQRHGSLLSTPAVPGRSARTDATGGFWSPGSLYPS